MFGSHERFKTTLTHYDIDTQSANLRGKLSPKMCRFCVRVIINKPSFEPFMFFLFVCLFCFVLDLVFSTKLERSRSVPNIVNMVLNVHRNRMAY